jgi:hypothetical protein
MPRCRAVLSGHTRRVPRVNDRRILNGIFWVLRSGAPWRDLRLEHLPPRGAFGPTFPPDVIATNRSASVPTSTVPATWLSGSLTRSSSVVGSRRATTNSGPTTSRSSSLQRGQHGRPRDVTDHSSLLSEPNGDSWVITTAQAFQ